MIRLNGKNIPVPSTMADVRLLEFLRHHVHLTGTKFGCGQGLCGACTVHVEGQAVRSCQTEMRDVIGKAVTTIEGLAGRTGDQLHPVQVAWIAESVPQCGYCQPGQIMSAAALLDNIPNPTDTEIRRQMNGNLCRCGTYSRIHKAIKRAAREGLSDEPNQ